MSRSRSLLHVNKLDAFKVWLVAQGWTIGDIDPKHGYEVLHAIDREGYSHSGYQRTGTDHVTVNDDLLRMAIKFVRERRNARDAEAALRALK